MCSLQRRLRTSENRGEWISCEGDMHTFQRNLPGWVARRKWILMKHHEQIKTAKVLSDGSRDCFSHWLLGKRSHVKLPHKQKYFKNFDLETFLASITHAVGNTFD